MKGIEIITHTVRAEMPDTEQLRENSIRIASEKIPVKRSVIAKYLLPAAACLTVAMAAAIAASVCMESVVIQGAEAVNKSYPGFFYDLQSLGGTAEIV